MRARRRRTRATAVAGSSARIRASPISAASNPSARQPDTVAGSRTPDSAIAIRSSGIRSRRRAARSGSTASVRRSRLLRPMTRASVASATSSSRSSCASTSDSRPRSRASRTRAERRGPRCSDARSSTRSAPAARTSESWRRSTTNSFARTGTETAARTRSRSTSEPPNQCGSHSTEIAVAPPAAYARARRMGSSDASAIRPAEGELRLTSAMT